MIVDKSQGRSDVLGLAMSLRATRLQHAFRMLPHKKHQLALETLQLWSPLSYQLGVSPHTPELEVHSYVLLFPRSFGAFLTWYGSFRGIAKHLVASLRHELQEKLTRDEILPQIAKKVVIQSRLKTPASAFKKMVRGAKQKHEMQDFVGMRLVVHCADADDSPVQGIVPAEYVNPSTARRESELLAIFRVLQLIGELKDWELDESRLKDYVTRPKASGYQSLHVILRHKHSEIVIEIQIRSQRMHWIAEYGSASHNNYKALILPETASTATT
jgi:GTP diphosphokinase / guanosine-3',5'-bis(diphosphate) 3'-diphosphatase